MALPLYEQILAAEPHNAYVWNLLGALQTAQANYPLAVEHLQAAVGLDGSQPSYHVNLGETYRRWGRNAEAVECLRQALALDPQQVDALNNLGIVLQSQGKLREAAECYERGLKLKPDVAEMYVNVGTLYDRQGLAAEAIRCFERALQLKPDLSTAHNNLAAVFTGQSRFDEARKLLEECLRLSPNCAEAWNNLGSIEQLRGASRPRFVTSRRPCNTSPLVSTRSRTWPLHSDRSAILRRPTNRLPVQWNSVAATGCV